MEKKKVKINCTIEKDNVIIRCLCCKERITDDWVFKHLTDGKEHGFYCDICKDRGLSVKLLEKRKKYEKDLYCTNCGDRGIKAVAESKNKYC